MQIKLVLLLLLCSVVWGSCGKVYVLPKNNKLQKLRNRAACVLTFSNYDADDLQLPKKLNWDNLETRRQILKAEMVYKSSNGLSPDYGSLAATNSGRVRDQAGLPVPYTIRFSALK